MSAIIPRRGRPAKRPFQVFRAISGGQPVFVLEVVCHGRRIGGMAKRHGFDPGDSCRVSAEARNRSALRRLVQDARTHLRRAQPNRHRIAHLGCYPRERVDAVMEARRRLEIAREEDRRSGGPLGRALAEIAYHSVHPYAQMDEVRRAVRTNDALTLKLAAELAQIRADEAGGGY